MMYNPDDDEDDYDRRHAERMRRTGPGRWRVIVAGGAVFLVALVLVAILPLLAVVLARYTQANGGD